MKITFWWIMCKYISFISVMKLFIFEIVQAQYRDGVVGRGGGVSPTRSTFEDGSGISVWEYARLIHNFGNLYVNRGINSASSLLHLQLLLNFFQLSSRVVFY